MIAKFRIPIPDNEHEKAQLQNFIDTKIKYYMWYSLNEISNNCRGYVYVYLIGTMLEKGNSFNRYALTHRLAEDDKTNWVTLKPHYKKTYEEINVYKHNVLNNRVDLGMQIYSPRNTCQKVPYILPQRNEFKTFVIRYVKKFFSNP